MDVYTVNTDKNNWKIRMIDAKFFKYRFEFPFA